MYNPYQTPQSNVSVEPKIKSKKKWRILFWFLLGLEVISVFIMSFDPSDSTIDVLVDIAVYSIVLTGLFGFSYDKKVLSFQFWRYVIPAAIVYDVYSMRNIGQEFVGIEDSNIIIFSAFLTAALILPLYFLQYYGLYLYSFRSSKLWAKSV